MKGSNIYHICNLSPKVIFRKEEDFLMAINRLATCSFTHSIEVLAYAIMSTHFHIVIRGNEENIKNFISHYKRNITVRHNKNYSAKIRLRINSKVISGVSHVLCAINYVLKNPIHHGVTQTSFEYPYSSCHVYFNDTLNRREYYLGEKKIQKYNKANELNTREYQKIFGRQKASIDFQILEKCLVIPESFISIKAVETIYTTAKNFLYQINRPLREDLEVFADDVDYINKHLNKNILTNQISDIDASKILDEYIHPRKYTEISEDEKNVLWTVMKEKGISFPQFQRLV